MGCGSSQTESRAPAPQTSETPRAVENNNKQKEEVKKEAAVSEEDIKQQKFREEVLASHNKYRAKHGAESLTQAADLDLIAQNWADHLVKNDIFEHSSTEYGENLWGGGPNATGKEVTEAHYSEIKHYNFANGGFSMETGHFTQVVWKGSKELGTGYARNNNGMSVVCCNYRPAGNMQGSFATQVSPP
ncbi:Golgi-associated plant pathogenesis-related protein 1 [Mizuhopecten yessoensis]|uniref:Golgi-associated plant pathogenesis-related protein 1 n=2 Tax=Mizuhopecten yessoensis TaxID=6573 RepID=A0A210QCM9_MIZYE|nr:Golgi-associated plant pathogenesis-related protein 1 [Mizuhopecten yessoensis]